MEKQDIKPKHLFRNKTYQASGKSKTKIKESLPNQLDKTRREATILHEIKPEEMIETRDADREEDKSNSGGGEKLGQKAKTKA